MNAKIVILKSTRALFKSKFATVGFIIICIIAMIAILSNYIMPYDPTAINVGRAKTPPCQDFPFGTDIFGRDILSRMLWGVKISLSLTLAVVALSFAMGVPLGLIAGYFGGIAEFIIMRATDIMLCFPWVLMALFIAAIIGPGIPVVILALTFVYIPSYIRLVHGLTLSIKSKEYVEAAIVTGETKLSIILRYILPNCMSALIVQSTLVISFVLLGEAAISYLGMGVQSPMASWGLMISEGAEVLFTAPHVSAIPGIAIVITVLAVNLFGDGLRDILDPKRTGGLREI